MSELIKERATLSELREFCNVVREAGAANPLDAILEAIPEETSQCLIARNLNFSCLVSGVELDINEQEELKEKWGCEIDSDCLWSMSVKDEELAKKIAEAINSIYLEDGPNWEIVLPRKIGNVANNFDVTYRNLPEVILGRVSLESIDEELVPLIDNEYLKQISRGIISEIEFNQFSTLKKEDINDEVIKLLGDNFSELGLNIRKAMDEWMDDKWTDVERS
jgi:hypothetical protein